MRSRGLALIVMSVPGLSLEETERLRSFAVGPHPDVEVVLSGMSRFRPAADEVGDRVWAGWLREAMDAKSDRGYVSFDECPVQMACRWWKGGAEYRRDPGAGAEKLFVAVASGMRSLRVEAGGVRLRLRVGSEVRWGPFVKERDVVVHPDVLWDYRGESGESRSDGRMNWSGLKR